MIDQKAMKRPGAGSGVLAYRHVDKILYAEVVVGAGNVGRRLLRNWLTNTFPWKSFDQQPTTQVGFLSVSRCIS